MATIKPLCKYGDKCFRKNPNHLKNFEHSLEKLENEENLNQKDDDKKSSDESEKLDILLKKSENFIEYKENLENLEKFDLSKIKGVL